VSAFVELGFTFDNPAIVADHAAPTCGFASHGFPWFALSGRAKSGGNPRRTERGNCCAMQRSDNATRAYM